MGKQKEMQLFIGVGSNINPKTNLLKGIDLLKRHITLEKTSTIYQTEPLDRPNQDPFLNGVWQGRSALSAATLKFEVLRAVEKSCGRRRSNDKHAPRPLDLDLLIYSDKVIATETLTVPDPDIWTRPFVALPLLELANLTLPNTGERLATVASGLSADGMTPLNAFTQQLRERLHYE